MLLVVVVGNLGEFQNPLFITRPEVLDEKAQS